MGEKGLVNFACGSDFHVNRRGLFTCHKSATWDRRLYFPSEGRHAVDFFTWIIQRLRPDSNPRSWVPEASMLTTRPPKPLCLGTQRQLATAEITATCGMVLQVIQRVKWLGRRIFVDSYFTSPVLFGDLCQCKISLYGTLHYNRPGFQHDIGPKSLKWKGDYEGVSESSQTGPVD
jgi:hypothetical protein